jgi:ABC-2 type transport system ATP-binding protein
VTPAIEIHALTKRFSDVAAVEDLSLAVPDGSVLGLLGPNGAGKTTLLKMLLGLTSPTSGSATVLSHVVPRDAVAVRRLVAFVPEDKPLYHDMRVDTFLRFYGGFFSGWSPGTAHGLVARWGIPTRRPIGLLAKGERTRLFLAATFARRPRLILLDEPTEGLDPAGIDDVLSLLAQWMSTGGRTAVVATHRLDEVERICDRIAVMHRGRVMVADDLDDLRSVWKTIRVVGALPTEAVAAWSGVHRVTSDGNVTTITVRSDLQMAIEGIAAFEPSSVETFDMSLREIYLALLSTSATPWDGDLEELV